MPILLKRRNGETTPFRNAEFIPAYYFIPKTVLEKCGAELNSIPRVPWELLHSWDAISVVESDLFRLLIIDAYAFMVWPFMGLGAKREIYSGYEPSWILAHSAGYWIQEMLNEEIIPTAQMLLANGGTKDRLGYVSEEEISKVRGGTRGAESQNCRAEGATRKPLDHAARKRAIHRSSP